MTAKNNTPPSVLDTFTAIGINGMREAGGHYDGPIPPAGTPEHAEWVRRQNNYMAEARRISAEWDGDAPPLDYAQLREDLAAIADENKR